MPDFLDMLSAKQALIESSHIVYTSGRHGSAYVNKDALYPDVQLMRILARYMIEPFWGYGIEAIIGPAMGGIILAQWAAHAFSERGQTVPAVFAEKNGEVFIIKRGYPELIRDKRVLIVEDVLTTGGSVIKVAEAARACTADIVGVSAICNRGGVTAEQLMVPRLASLVEVSLQSWAQDECPLCRDQVPINTEVGKGREYLAGKG